METMSKALAIMSVCLAPLQVQAQTVAEAERLSQLCQRNFEHQAYHEAVKTCNQALAIALPLARQTQQSGQDKFNAGQFRSALADFLEMQRIWMPIFTSFFGRGLAYSMLGDPQATARSMREASGSKFLMAEAFINAGKAQVALSDRAAATRSFVEALELNQEALQAFEGNTEAGVAGRGFYLRGVAKAALADLGSPRGDRKEACDAYRRSAKLGYMPALNFLASDNGQWCR